MTKNQQNVRGGKAEETGDELDEDWEGQALVSSPIPIGSRRYSHHKLLHPQTSWRGSSQQQLETLDL
jgi:hypothetical protein